MVRSREMAGGQRQRNGQWAETEKCLVSRGREMASGQRNGQRSEAESTKLTNNQVVHQLAKVIILSKQKTLNNFITFTHLMIFATIFPQFYLAKTEFHLLS